MGKRIGLILGAGLAGTALAGYAIVIRPWLLQWGMRDSKGPLTLPGDEFVPHARYESTRAIMIDAPASRVWQWLVQIGVGRGGFYTYDTLENMANLNIHSTQEIRPEWQTLQVGDSIQISPVTPLRVEIVEPNRALVLHIIMSPFTAQVVDRDAPATSAFMDWTWAFVLDEIAPQTTRLIVRVRADYQPDRLWLLALTLLEPIHFVMECGMLQGLKRRAEGHSTPRS